MRHEHGNIFLFILIAVALFAGLTFVLSRGQDGGEQSTLSKADLQTRAQKLLSYVGSVSQGWLQMQNMGSDLDELSLMLPSHGSFNTAPTIHKIFHPDGGGVTYRDMNEDSFRANSTAPVGWKFILVNADFSDSTGTDFIMTYLNLRADLCAKINKMVRDDATIPSVTVNFTNTFVNGTSSLTEAQCAECARYTSICVENGGTYSFYNMIEQR